MSLTIEARNERNICDKELPMEDRENPRAVKSAAFCLMDSNLFLIDFENLEKEL
jgi:hypothetical protein